MYYSDYLTYIIVSHDELGESVLAGSLPSLLDLADLLMPFSTSDNIDQNTAELDSSDTSICQHRSFH